jgi:hypothetical protein
VSTSIFLKVCASMPFGGFCALTGWPVSSSAIFVTSALSSTLMTVAVT